MGSISATLHAFNSYLQGESIINLEQHLQKYDGKRWQVNTDFHSMSIDDDDIKSDVVIFLSSLFICQNEQKQYFNSGLTVYELLLKLNRNSIANVQTEYLIELINKKSRLRKRDYLLIGAWITAILAIAATIPGFSTMVMALYALLTSVRVFPIVGLVYSLATTAYSIFSHQFDRKIPLYDRIRNNFFVVASLALNITAYGIWISSAISMSPVVAGLFVASACMHVLKDSAALIRELRIKYSHKHVYQDDNPLDVTVDYVRHEYSFRKHRNAALINLATAVLLAGVMAAWNFIPGGFVLSIIGVTSIVAIYGVKMLLTRKNDTMIREGLQQELLLSKQVYEGAKQRNPKESAFLIQEGLPSVAPRTKQEVVPRAKIDDISESQYQGENTLILQDDSVACSARPS